MKQTFNLISFLFIVGLSVSAHGSVTNFNKLIDEAQKAQSETEGRIIDLIGVNELGEEKIIREFYENKKLVEFVLEAPAAKIQITLVPIKESSSKASPEAVVN